MAYAMAYAMAYPTFCLHPDILTFRWGELYQDSIPESQFTACIPDFGIFASSLVISE